MEGTESKLRTRLTDGLCGDDTDSLALLHHAAGGKVATVALHADALAAFAGEDGTNFDFFDTALLNGHGDGLSDFFAGSYEKVAIDGMIIVVNTDAAQDTLGEAGDNLIAVLQSRAGESSERPTIFFSNDHIVADIDKTTSEITGVGSLEGGIGKTLAGTVGRDKVFEHRHSLLKIGENGVFDGRTSVGTRLLGLCHQTTHTSELSNLVCTTTGSRVEHHEDGIETLVGLGHLLHENVFYVLVHFAPSVDNLMVTLVFGDETQLIVRGNLFYVIMASLHDGLLLLRDNNIGEVEGESAFVSLAVAQILDTIEELAGTSHTDALDDGGNEVAESAFLYYLIEIAHLVRNNLVDNDTSDGGLNDVADRKPVKVEVIYQHTNGSMHINAPFIVGDDGFFRSVESQTRTLCSGTKLCDIVETEHHILRRHCDRRAISRIENVVALEHQHLTFEDGFVGKREMDSHLVAIEVGVEGGTCQRVELNGLSLNHLRLESLDGKTVE